MVNSPQQVMGVDLSVRGRGGVVSSAYKCWVNFPGDKCEVLRRKYCIAAAVISYLARFIVMVLLLLLLQCVFVCV